jgi:hypothetical protein
MSTVPSLFEGMAGRAQTNVLMPTTGLSGDVMKTRDPRVGYAHTHVAPPMFNSAIDYSSRNGVLPCVGITHHVLREPPSNPANAYQAPMGVGRGQARGLQYSVPLNNPVMPRTSSVFAGKMSKL